MNAQNSNPTGLNSRLYNDIPAVKKAPAMIRKYIMAL